MKEKVINFMGDYDIFAVPFNFKYKRMDKYSTPLSLIFCNLYIIFSIYFIEFNFILFITRQNFDLKIHSLVDNYKNRIYVMNSKLDFVYRLDCWLYESTKPLEDLLQVDITASYYFIVDSPGPEVNTLFMNTKRFDIFNCTYNRDYRQFQKVDAIDESNYKCLDLSVLSLGKNGHIENYSMIVSLKDSSEKNFYDINDYLLNNDCKKELSLIDYDILIDE